MTGLETDSDPALALPNFVELLRFRASTQSDTLGYTFLPDGEGTPATLTYGQLDERAGAVAVLLEQHVEPGGRVLLCYPPGIDFIFGFFGCLYANRVAVPAYPPRPNRPMTALEAIATHAQVSAVLATQEITGGRRARSAQTPAFPGVRWLVTDSLELSPAAAWAPRAIPADSIPALQLTPGPTVT